LIAWLASQDVGFISPQGSCTSISQWVWFCKTIISLSIRADNSITWNGICSHCYDSSSIHLTNNMFLCKFLLYIFQKH
jgi:hypothetical protein